MADEPEIDIEEPLPLSVVASPKDAAARIEGSEVTSTAFAPTLTVIEKGRRRIEVATTAAANRARWQVMSSKFTTILNRRLDEILETDEVPDTKELQKLAVTAEAIQTLSVMAYEGKKPLANGAGSELERLAMGAVEAATKGAVKGMTDGFATRERLKRIRELGSKQGLSAQIIEIPKNEP